jgi:hypothetical protein
MTAPLRLNLLSESYVTTDCQSASLFWNKAPIWGLRPDTYYSLTITVLFLWGALSDERTGVSCICYWPSPAQSFLGPSPFGFVACMNKYYDVKHTSLTMVRYSRLRFDSSVHQYLSVLTNCRELLSDTSSLFVMTIIHLIINIVLHGEIRSSL